MLLRSARAEEELVCDLGVGQVLAEQGDLSLAPREIKVRCRHRSERLFGGGECMRR